MCLWRGILKLKIRMASEARGPPNFRTELPHRTSAPNFCTELSHRTAAPNFCTELLHRTFAPNFRTELLHRTSAPNFRTELLHRTAIFKNLTLKSYFFTYLTNSSGFMGNFYQPRVVAFEAAWVLPTRVLLNHRVHLCSGGAAGAHFQLPWI